jgi:hypothetical protein
MLNYSWLGGHSSHVFLVSFPHSLDQEDQLLHARAHVSSLSLSLSLCEYISDANSQIPSPILSFDLILGALSPHVRSNK